MTPAVDALFDALHDEVLAEDWPAGREHVIDRYRQLPFPFDGLDVPDFEMPEHWSLAQYLAYLRSWSASQRHLARTGRDAVSELEQSFRAAWGDTDRRVVHWPLSLKAGRT